MNYYKRHIGDYMKDAAHLSLLEHGAYTRLLDVYYTRECGIPDAMAERLVSARTSEEVAAVRQVLREFFALIEPGNPTETQMVSGDNQTISVSEPIWVQKRCETELKVAHEKAAANRENGKSGGRPIKKPAKPGQVVENKQEGTKPIGNPTETQMVSGDNPEKTQAKPKPLTTNHYNTSSLRSDDAFASPAPELPIPDALKATPKTDPTDPKTILWREGRAIVGRLTGDDTKAVGKLVGTFADDAKSADGDRDYALVLGVLREAEKQRPGEPIPWIRAAIKARISPGGLFGASRPHPDDPGGVNAWCAANGGAPTTSPKDMQRAKWLVSGMLFDQIAVEILLVTGMRFDIAYDWDFLRQWAETGIDADTIYQTIKRMAESFRARGDYAPPGSLKFFDKAVRAAAGRTAA